MIGGLFKSASRVALIAAAGVLAGSVAAQAADLGGNCCADLEERVAELEATAARKGNRKVSLTVYGAVNQAILWHDDKDGHRPDKATVITNDAYVSRFGFRGEAQIRPDLTAGYLLEIGIYDDKGLSSSTGSLLIRQNHVYLNSQTFGRVTLGQASQVTDGLFTINLANAQLTPGEMDEAAEFLSTPFVTTFKTPYDGGRMKGVYYQTPSLAGFVLSAGWSHGTNDKDKEYVEWKDRSLFTTADSYKDADEYWEVALKYAGEFNGVRIAAGIGYRKEEDNTVGLTAVHRHGGHIHAHKGEAADSKVWMGSASVMHMPTGLFVSGGYGNKNSDDDLKDSKGWWVMAGIEKNWTGIGNTTLFAEYMKNDLKVNAALVYSDATHTSKPATQHDGHYWGFGVVQSIEAAATDLYLNMRKYELDSISYDLPEASGHVKGHDATVVVGGMIIKF